MTSGTLPYPKALRANIPETGLVLSRNVQKGVARMVRAGRFRDRWAAGEDLDFDQNLIHVLQGNLARAGSKLIEGSVTKGLDKAAILARLLDLSDIRKRR